MTGLNKHDLTLAFDIDCETIRHWEKKGLIKSTRNSQGDRVFDPDEIKRLRNRLNGLSSDNYKVLKAENKTHFTCIELFAGAGGTALGMQNAGIKHLLFNEFNPDAAETLRRNFVRVDIIEDDVRHICFEQYRNKVDIVQAGFPCQAFSYAGNRLGFDEVRGTLFFEFARCVKDANPKIAVGENVCGLLNHDHGKTLKTMLKVFDELGYRVACRVLRSQFLDVPQKRERLIIIAVRKDLHMPFVFPKEKNYTISLREALKNCPESAGHQYPEKKRKVLELVPEGGNWKDLPVDIQKSYMGDSFFSGGGKTGIARRLSWNEPSPTLTCFPAQKLTECCHPSKTRPLTVREYARIQTFPDSWEFSGSTTSQYRQIGNAVPVNLGYHIGRCLIAMLTGKFGDDMDVIHPEDSDS